MAAAEDAAGELSLVDYVRQQRRADCAVCSLPDEIRIQLKGASDKKISRATALAWLSEVHGIVMTSDQMTTHYSAHHDS